MFTQNSTQRICFSNFFLISEHRTLTIRSTVIPTVLYRLRNKSLFQIIQAQEHIPVVPFERKTCLVFTRLTFHTFIHPGLRLFSRGLFIVHQRLITSWLIYDRADLCCLFSFISINYTCTFRKSWIVRTKLNWIACIRLQLIVMSLVMWLSVRMGSLLNEVSSKTKRRGNSWWMGASYSLRIRLQPLCWY